MNLCYSCMQQKQNKEETCLNCGYINGTSHDEHYYLTEGTYLNNRYTIGRVLGHGGFGITYLGLDTKLNLKIAIKEYLPGEIATRAEGESTVKSYSGDKYDAFVYGMGRFMDEAQTLAKYNHFPCIVSITDFFEANNTAYIVMEYLDGISLSEYIKRSGGKISQDETLSIMRPVIDALREVHKFGMIHRDVSPDNIFITQNKLVKLIDFGAARHAMSEKSKSLSVVLKPGYAPPEQYYTRGKQGPWTDVYATAATMFKMLTGVTPVESMERMAEDGQSDLIEMNNITDTQIKGALRKAMSLKYTERFASMDKFYESLYIHTDIDIKKQNAADKKTFEETDKKQQIIKKEEHIIKSDDSRKPSSGKIKTTMKAALSIIVSIVIIMIILASINGAEKPEATAINSISEKKSTNEPEVEEENSIVDINTNRFPIIKEGENITMSIFMAQKGNIDSFDAGENWFTDYFIDLTGVKFDIISSTIEEQDEKLQLMIAAGQTPDLLLGVGNILPPNMQIEYAEWGIIIPLDDLFEENAYFAKQAIEAFPGILDEIRLPDGHFYGMPGKSTCVFCEHPGKMWINEEWLNRLDLDYPETTDDFYDVLVAFRDWDPNGNGIHDEIPLAGSISGWGTKVDIFLMNAFVPNDNDKRLYIYDGIVTPSYILSGWREGLKYLRKLCDDELIMKDSFTMDNSKLTALGENQIEMILGSAPGGYTGAFTETYGDSNRWLMYSSLPALKGPKGTQYTGYKPNEPRAEMFITSSCEKPDIAMLVLDAFYDIDVNNYAMYGEMGVDWEYLKSGEKGLDGKTPAIVVPLYGDNEVINKSWNYNVPRLFPNYDSLIYRGTDDDDIWQTLYNTTVEGFYPYKDEEVSIYPPTWRFTNEQLEVISSIEYEMKIYIDEMTARFALGQDDIYSDDDWNGYLSTLEAIGLQDYIDIHQQAYDAIN